MFKKSMAMSLYVCMHVYLWSIPINLYWIWNILSESDINESKPYRARCHISLPPQRFFACSGVYYRLTFEMIYDRSSRILGCGDTNLGIVICAMNMLGDYLASDSFCYCGSCVWFPLTLTLNKEFQDDDKWKWKYIELRSSKIYLGDNIKIRGNGTMISWCTSRNV